MSAVVSQHGARRRRRRRMPARGRSEVVNVLGLLAGLGFALTMALGVTGESSGTLSAPGGYATAAGRLTGLAAAYAMIVVVVLVARFGPLERAVGQDRLVRWHRTLGPWPLYLLAAHGTLITIGYAQAAGAGLVHELGQLLWTYTGVLAATVGGVLLIAAGVSSYRLARRRMAYETWWSVHLYTYLALLVSFSHQVDTGESFVGHPAARLWWTALWAGTLALVLASRVGLPVWRSLRHRLTVVEIAPEGTDTTTVVLEGRQLDRLPVAGGQFLQWRFLRRGMWWQAHPYSLSAAPTGRQLRITVKDLGDHSNALRRIRPGTRVAIEGPYGTFTADARHNDRVLLIGAGVGITPVHALLEELPEHVDVVTLLRGSTRDDIVLAREIAHHVRRHRGQLHQLIGPRHRVALDHVALRQLVPDIAERDVYLCGPEPLQRALVAAAGAAGVPAAHIHHESFAF